MEFAVEVLILFVLLVGAVGVIAALLAFNVARSGGKSKQFAARDAGVAFIATTTLAILLLNFIGVGDASHQMPSQPGPSPTPALRP
jgi:hypothetical protein